MMKHSWFQQQSCRILWNLGEFTINTCDTLKNPEKTLDLIQASMKNSPETIIFCTPGPARRVTKSDGRFKALPCLRSTWVPPPPVFKRPKRYPKIYLKAAGEWMGISPNIDF